MRSSVFVLQKLRRSKQRIDERDKWDGVSVFRHLVVFTSESHLFFLFI